MQIISSYIFFNDTATSEIYTLSLHDALPICLLPDGLHGNVREADHPVPRAPAQAGRRVRGGEEHARARSEEHTSELQSRQYLVCRLLLEKKTTYVLYLLHYFCFDRDTNHPRI